MNGTTDSRATARRPVLGAAVAVVLTLTGSGVALVGSAGLAGADLLSSCTAPRVRSSRSTSALRGRAGRTRL